LDRIYVCQTSASPTSGPPLDAGAARTQSSAWHRDLCVNYGISRIAAKKFDFPENSLPDIKRRHPCCCCCHLKGSPMKAAHRRLTFLICAALTTVMPLCGCTVGSKSFSMDSISRMPFFGLELKERKPKSSAPSYNSISQASGNVSRIKPALGVGSAKLVDLSAKPVDLTKTADRRLAGATVSGTVTNEVHGSGMASKQVAKALRPQSIPLPRTDERPGSGDRRAASSVVDFQ
jgi:hypothetical protein